MNASMSEMTWICCPKCGSIDGPFREGEVGVPQSRLGSRRRRKDSNRFECKKSEGGCGSYFHSDGATRREVMGYNVSGRDETAVQGWPV